MRRAAAIFLLIVAACGRSRATVIEYAKGHASALVATTRPLWSADKGREIPESDYPPDVRALDPTRVVATENGVLIYVYTSYANVTGVFIRHNASYSPPHITTPDSTDPSYEPIAKDVYWLTIPR